MSDPGQNLGGSAFGAASGMYSNQMFGQAAHGSSSGLATRVTVRIPKGLAAGIPELGVLAKPTFDEFEVPVYVFTITPQDVYNSAGFYETGDILLGFEQFAANMVGRVLFGNEAEINREGMRVIFGALEYRIQGQVQFEPIGETNIVAKLHLRKLGLAR